MTWTAGAAEQGDEADEAFGGTNPRAASGARPEVPPHARAGRIGRGHRFAAYPRCWADNTEGPTIGLSTLTINRIGSETLVSRPNRRVHEKAAIGPISGGMGLVDRERGC